MNWKIVIILLIVLLVAGGGYFYYQSTQSAAETKTEEKTETSDTPTETPTPEVKKDAFSIELMNGSGIAGEAGRAQELLEAAEFKIDSTGNAENYDFEETVIQAKADVDEGWLDSLKAELEKKYTVKSSVTKLEDSDSESDVVVIVGSFDDSGKSMVPEVTPEEETAEEDTTPTPTGEEEDTTPTLSPSPSPSPTGT